MYKMPALADFRTQFPELTLAAYPDALVQRWIDQSDPFFNQCRWDDMLFLGVLYWVAHQLVSAKADATQQTIDDGIMKKVGDIAKTRDASLMNKQADNPYYRTVYGHRYLEMRQMVGAGGGAV